MKLSNQQKEVLTRIKEGYNTTAYTHGHFLRTQKGLAKRGLVDFYGEISSLYPEINLPEFVRLTEKGKKISI